MAKAYLNEEHELNTDPLLLPNNDISKIPHMIPPPAYGDNIDDTFFATASAPPSEFAPPTSHADANGAANDGDDESSLHISSSNDSNSDSDSNPTPSSRARRNRKRNKKRKAPKPIQHSRIAGVHLEMCDSCCHLDLGVCGCALWMCEGCIDLRCWALDWFHNISGMDERGIIQGGKRRIDKGKGRANALRL